MASDLTSLHGKTVLITGATSGIGAAAARGIARAGARTVLAGRNQNSCRLAAEAVRRATGNTNVDFLVGDLSSQREIRDLAEEFRGRFGSLDVLVNNAGAIFKRREISVDGLEMTFAVNHLAYFLLTLLLLDLLRTSPAGRIIVVSSHAHEGAELDFNDLQSEQKYSRLDAYGRSKLANLLFTYELARRLRGTGVTVNALTPGAVATGLGSNNGWLKAKVRNLVFLAKGSMIMPEMGAKTSVYLAGSPELQGVTGSYFREEKAIPSSPASRDPEAAARLWEMSEQLTGVRFS
jgi:NAD(P)-dependent dehydrogenase (short-subunit alcohol dehydrogenase family)